MPVIRRQIKAEEPALASFIEGVRRLKAETHAVEGVEGLDAVSTYDSFVLWHYQAMMFGGGVAGRNLAHVGPVFLPWHRYMLLVFERHLQRVLDDTTFALPYWNWVADGATPATDQHTAFIWRPEGIGGQGSPVADGPFTEGSGFVVRLHTDALANLRIVRRGLRRLFREGGRRLPKVVELARAMAASDYDASPWDRDAASFRNYLEGWLPRDAKMNAQLHNLVHAWIGGDMKMATSPNDPVFFLHHANVDRIWSAWQQKHGSSPYLPNASDADAPAGHRLNDPFDTMVPDGDIVTPADMLDVSSVYVYDTVADLL